MIDYKRIWDSINTESKCNPLQPQIARRIPSAGLFEAFLATDVRKGIRILYIKLENEQNIAIEKLPKFKGLEISIQAHNIGEFTNEIFLRFTQSIPNTDDIFELFISDLCDKVINLRTKNIFSISLIRTLNEWKYFFDRQENDILSIDSQKGLVGELHFLVKYLLEKYSLIEALSFWTGPEKTNHDFQIKNIAVEVKTTSSKQHKKITISSERQLDNTGLEHLYLALFSINIHSTNSNLTLPTIIHKIYVMMQDEPYALFRFRTKLLKYGYNDALADKYTLGFSISEIRLYEVVDGFPRILLENLPNGVGDIKYSVMVAACDSFEITTNPLNEMQI